MIKRGHHLLTIATAIGALTAATVPVDAASQRVSHAIEKCQITNGAHNEAAPSTTGVIYISSFDPTAVVACGLDRQNITNTNGLQDLDIRLKNFLGSPNTVTCSVTALRPTDAFPHKTVTKSITLAAFASGTLDFGTSLNSSVAYGHYVVECSLPNGTGLWNFLTREY